MSQTNAAQKWKVTPFNWGSFALDGGAMFGVVPKSLWSMLIQADEQNRIPMGLNSLYLEKSDFKVLVDLGMGNDWNEKAQKIYQLQSSPLDLILKNKLNIKREEITHIILTHLHFDHCGFLAEKKSKEWLCAFPNAEIVLLEENFKNARNPNAREKASYIDHFWGDALMRKQFNLIPCEWLEMREVLPGVHLRRVDGHTQGQAIVYIEGTHTDTLFLGDLCPTPHHLKPHYVMGYDVNPLLSIKEKEIVLSEAENSKRALFFEHNC
jgi:glyoxylase-like metal-dependent hydrolase (beta-lactamase superfamily II)